jgi:hypothetical protein
VIAALQPGNPDIPPAGTAIVNVRVEPENVPASVPVNVTISCGVLATTAADTD